MKAQTGFSDKVATVFRILGVYQYSLLRQQTYLATHPFYGACIVKFAATVFAKQQLKVEAEFLYHHSDRCWPQYLDYGSNMGIDWLIVEFFDSLSSGLGNMTVEDQQKITTSAEEALNTLHNNGYVHGDIKPSNLIITLQNEVKLVDFGSITPIGSDYHSNSILSLTPKFCALNPYLRSGQALPKHDYYSLAISLHTMWRAHPFSDLTLVEFARTNGSALLEGLFSRYQILVSNQLKYAKQFTY